jgi:hypothetical protein
MRKLVIAVAAILAFSNLSWAARLDVPILIGGYEGDVCGVGQVIGLDPMGDGFLSVRSGPGGQAYREIDRLFNRDEIYLCGFHGQWFKVVYHQSRKPHQSCGVTFPWSKRRPYDGSCRSGWVHSKFIKVIAG